MQNYTKIDKIDHFLMCIKTNKKTQNPQNAIQNHLVDWPERQWFKRKLTAVNSSLGGKTFPGRDVLGRVPRGEFFLNILARQSAIPDFCDLFLVRKSFFIKSLNYHSQIWVPQVRQCLTNALIQIKSRSVPIYPGADGYFRKSSTLGSEIQPLYGSDNLQAGLAHWKFLFLWVNGAEYANNPAN